MKYSGQWTMDYGRWLVGLDEGRMTNGDMFRASLFVFAHALGLRSWALGLFRGSIAPYHSIGYMERTMSLLSVSLPRCEYRDNPLGIDVGSPRLSWQLQSDRRGARQVAYQIRAAASEAVLANSAELLWDTGRVESDQSIQVAYAGPVLQSAQRVYWSVTVWDDAGEQAASAPAWWEMGLLERGDWEARWIGAPFRGGPHTTSPAPYLRTTFILSQPVRSARLYITALGLYESSLNGQRVGEELLTPGWTNYAKRVQYQVYDVASQLQQGENALGSILGDGWGVGHIGWGERQRYVPQPLLLARLVITLADGSRQIVITDESWKASSGPILESDMMMGESYDARQELSGWDNIGYDDTGWWPAKVFDDTGAALVATNGPAIRGHEQITPVDVHEIPSWPTSRWVFDLGQNMVGWIRLRVSGPAGTTITIRYAEVLNQDGTLYTANLRGARNIDRYTLKGDGEEIWEPRFLFHGFRYVDMIGFPGTATAESVTGIVVHSDTPSTGEFSCSDPLINQLQHNIVWGQKGNFVDVPTDCPQRDERLGWTGDAQVFVRTAAFNKDVAGFFTKWAQDVVDAQRADGAYPSVAPNPAASIDDGGPAWADAGIICPWTIYQCYGDTRLLEAHYESMQRFVGFLSETSRDGLRCYADYQGWHGFGDWLALDGSGVTMGGTPKELIGTAFFAYSARLLGRIAEQIGRTEDAARYEALFQDVRAAFQKRFVTPSGLLAAQTQTAYVLALHFDLLPQELRATAAGALVHDIRQRKTHLSTGFVGTPYLPFVLTEAGYLDTAYELLKQTTWPSWLYSVTQGATTIWERWDGWTHDRGFQDPGMNSFNHYAYGAIGSWMYAVVAGIDTDQEQPAFKRAILRPRPGGGLTRAQGALNTPYGRIESAWRIEEGLLIWDVIIPANTTALTYVPASADQAVYEGNAQATQAAGISFVRQEEQAAVYELGAGRYTFRVGSGQ
jgi:alpha-L-rhamnosidase